MSCGLFKMFQFSLFYLVSHSLNYQQNITTEFPQCMQYINIANTIIIETKKITFAEITKRLAPQSLDFDIEKYIVIWKHTVPLENHPTISSFSEQFVQYMVKYCKQLLFSEFPFESFSVFYTGNTAESGSIVFTWDKTVVNTQKKKIKYIAEHLGSNSQ